MRNELPNGHGLNFYSESNLIHKVNQNPSVTDVQYDALEAGIGRGESGLVISPTSTGKTQIALWAMSDRLVKGGRVVYLVTHRALAKQKFQDLVSSKIVELLDNDLAKIVIATGDEVATADGNSPKDPLQSDLLVATYEKYLGLLAGSGMPESLANICIICDEVQLLGDAHRGQSVEILLTLLRNAGWGQLVALSAVISVTDASNLADWLGVSLVVQVKREKHLTYECWSTSSMSRVSTERSGFIEDGLAVPVQSSDCLSAVRWLLNQSSSKPIIVFCMKKDDTVKLARDLLRIAPASPQEQLSFEFLDMPDTNARSLLHESLIRRIAVHNADLTEEERSEVERSLLEGKVDVVFATSSLAAGVNFPFGTAVFSSWKRWNSSERIHKPIESSEFHNMSGRAGRMGFEHDAGRAIFFADGARDLINSRKFLELDRVESLEPRIEKSHFPSLILQLVAAGICSNESQLISLISQTFSGLREADKNPTAFSLWPQEIIMSSSELVRKGFLHKTESGELVATPIGKAVAHTGLQPATCHALLSAMSQFGSQLASWLPTDLISGNTDSILFTLARIGFSCPEFQVSSDALRTRFLPYQLENRYVAGAQSRIACFNNSQLSTDHAVINAASIACDWAGGASLLELEAQAPMLAAGSIRDFIRNLAWILQGLSSILMVATDEHVPTSLRVPSLTMTGEQMKMARRLPRAISMIVRRLNEGLPEKSLWLLELNGRGQPFKLNRDDILRLNKNLESEPMKVMSGDFAISEVRAACFPSARPTPYAKANWVRDRARAWKSQQRVFAAEKQTKRAKNCQKVNLIESYYQSLGNNFEIAFEAVLSHLSIKWERLDDRMKIGAPDYLVEFVTGTPIVFELKTRELDRLVDYNKAVEVLAASEIHGQGKAFCVTLCHPGVDPSVPSVITSCGRLAVIESHDLAEALLRICEGDLSREQLNRWITTPGQATAADLPYREN